MEYMKKIPTLFIIISLVAMNIAFVTCVHASMVDDGNGSEVTSFLDIDNDIPSKQVTQCSQCSCHAASHITLSDTNIGNYDVPSENHLVSRDGIYPSALIYPPFQPPKA